MSQVNEQAADLTDALERIANPVQWEEEHLDPAYDMNWPMLMSMLAKPEYYQRVAREALEAVHQAAPLPDGAAQ